MKALITHTMSLGRSSLATAIGTSLLLVLSGPSSRADWPDNNPNVPKWIQYPDSSTNGYDVLAGNPPPGPAGPGPAIVLADDFRCTQSGPITDIHLWASWLDLNGATTVPLMPITLSFWTDVPAVTNADGLVTPSHPGSLLWSQVFGPGQYAVRPTASVPDGETFWNPDPAPAGAVLGSENIIWQYNFYPTNPFVQQVGTIYWLSMTAGQIPTGTFFGWKTTATNHWNDDAVFGHLDPASGQPAGDWKELIDPRTLGLAAQRSLDFSFVLTTPENPPPPPPPPPPTNVKWVEGPNLFGGYDINATAPYVVADDFLCTNVSTITNIQIFSSFANDMQDTNLTFVLGIWSDVPALAAVGYSHPGHLLWTETFPKGTYTNYVYANGQEEFYTPATQQAAPDSTVYLYSFTPKRPFCQQGSLRSPIVYWLSVYAVPSTVGTALQYGWKTSTNHFRDDAVYGTINSGIMGNWIELFAPFAPAPISLDMAFILQNGPPSPECDRQIRPKWVQRPDLSPNGLDVFATGTNMVGDDFLCRSPGPISGITIWGSWRGDQVDTNATFDLQLWTDVPAVPGTSNPFSHPGRLLCETVFSPPQTVGTSVQRYNYSLAADHLQEKFFDPDLGTAGFIGTDSQIWRYDFYPYQPSCWIQRGEPFAAGTLYWVTINCRTTPGLDYQFGVKTATNQLFDNAVFGHLTNGAPKQDWADLIDPRVNKSLDLSHALWNFPVHGINKDLTNNTTAIATGIQLVVAGIHLVTWHYDGVPPWPNFQVSYAAGNTVLEWSGLALPPGLGTHVGFEMAATANPTIVSMNWMNSGALLSPPAVQGNFHFLNNGTILVVVNNLAPIPLQISGATIEWYPGPVALDQMTATGQRSPMASATLPRPPNPCLPGGAALIPCPPPPPGSMYEIIIVALSDPNGSPGTTDYLLVPLDAGLQPEIDSISTMNPGATGGGAVNLMFTGVTGRTYRILKARDMASPLWMDSGLGEFQAWDSELNVMLPITDSQAFYRIALMPQ